MSYNIKHALEKAAKQTVYGSIGIADDKRGYIRANASPDAANLAVARLRQLSEGAEEAQGIPASTSISALHFKKAIQDFGETGKALHEKGDQDGAKLADDAFGILVSAYINATGDRDVYRAMPQETILELDTLS